MSGSSPLHFALAWLLPLMIGALAWHRPWMAAAAMLAWQVALALAERVPAWQHSAPPVARSVGGFRWVVRAHVPLQAAVLALGLVVVGREGQDWGAALLLGLAIGGVTGAQGITFAHELGHSRSRADRLLAWALMASVNYSHFMVEHYRGHHRRAATAADPASARRGESLWRFLPRTLAGSWASAWKLEAQDLQNLGRGWLRSPLAWALALQGAWAAVLTVFWGPLALLFWVVQSVYAVYLLETINYIEHYGLERRSAAGRPEPFGVGHAWNADHRLTNWLTANLQRHSDHHLHAWKPYPTLAAFPGPQLPTGYAGCLFLAPVPALWFRLMHPRLAALSRA